MSTRKQKPKTPRRNKDKEIKALSIMLYSLCAYLDSYYAGVPESLINTRLWWAEQKRIETEKKRQANERLAKIREKALAKLTNEERKALGL